MKKYTRFVAVGGLAVALLGASGNAAAKPLPADLIVSNVVSYVGTDGAEMLRVLIKNQGQGPAGAFNVSTTGTGGNNANYVKFFGGLAAGAQASFSYSPGLTTGCDFIRTFTVDGANQVAETNEGNNSKTFNAAYCPRPDLVIKTETINPGGGVNEYQAVYVTNVGTATASNVMVNHQSQGGQVPSDQMGPFTIAQGQTQSMAFLIGAECDYTMNFRVDQQDVVDEYNETNNSATAVDSCN
jgi:subtilase family serine protease